MLSKRSAVISSLSLVSIPSSRSTALASSSSCSVSVVMVGLTGGSNLVCFGLSGV